MALTKITTDSIDLSADTTALKIPKGTTAERLPLGISLEYLVVAGGGGASNGGGGAGGYRTGTLSITPATNITLTVGGGGAGALQGSGDAAAGSDSVFSTITSTGGGGGNKQYDGATTNMSGGSGAGGGGYPATRKGLGNTPSTTPSQGNDGAGGAYGSNYSGGGGGGAGAVGTAGVGTTAGSGGIGATTTIIDTTLAVTYNVGEVDSGSLYFAGGGAGGSKNDLVGYTPGTGGLGGGADTPASAGQYGQDGTANTGGAASGATWLGGTASPYSGGGGGSGVIILKTTGIVSTTFSAGCTVNGTPGAQTTNGDISTGNSIFIITVAGALDTITFPITGSLPTVGLIRENTDTGNVEVYNGTAWRALRQTGQDTGIVPTNNFNPVLYDGNNPSTQSITGVGFQPDLVWVKLRSATGYGPVLANSVSGAQKFLDSSNTSGEVTSSSSLTSFDADGFGVGAYGNWNGGASSANGTMVSWNWKAGGNANTFNKDGTGYASALLAGLTAGNLATTGSSVNTEAGFSIINYTGNITADASFPHGLSSQPDLVIIKNKVSGAWCVYNSSLAASENLYLNTDAGAATDNHIRSANATTVTVSDDTIVNSSTASSMIAYSWTSIPGYSLIGSYTGTGSATNTPMIYTGFEPAWIMVKRTDPTGEWNIVDNKRSTSNPRDLELFANLSDAEPPAANYIDFNADGFQIITTGYFNTIDWNEAGGKYLFMCFAS